MTKSTKTLFQKKAEAYQKDEDRTKEDALSSATTVIVASGVLLVLWGIGYLLLRNSKPSLATALLVLCGITFIGVIIGLFMYISGSTRATKAVTCPKCDTKHVIYKSEKKYMCTNCTTLLLLSESTTGAPQFSNCLYCGLETAVEADHGRFLCPNCGIIRQAIANEQLERNATCSTCNQPLPAHAIYCTECGTFQTTNFSAPVDGDQSLVYDMDWEIGKDAFGHLNFAKALLQNTQDETRNAKNVKDIEPLLDSITKSLFSIEEALQDTDTWPFVQDMLPQIDIVYASILEQVTHILQNTDPKELKKGQVTWSEPHLPARRRIEYILGESSIMSNSIGLWNENLVEMESFETRDIRGEKTSRDRISNYKHLLDERDRFTTWTKEQNVQESILAHK